MIDVEANGQHYQEMNADAGAVAQTFLYPVYLGYRMNFQSGEFARERDARSFDLWLRMRMIVPAFSLR